MEFIIGFIIGSAVSITSILVPLMLHTRYDRPPTKDEWKVM